MNQKSKDLENLRSNSYQNRNRNKNSNSKIKFKSFNNFNNSVIISRKHRKEKDLDHKNKLRKIDANSIDDFEKIKNRIKTLLKNKYNIETELSISNEFEKNKKQFNNISINGTPLNNKYKNLIKILKVTKK